MSHYIGTADGLATAIAVRAVRGQEFFSLVRSLRFTELELDGGDCEFTVPFICQWWYLS